MIFFYKKSDGKVFSYVAYELESGNTNIPSKEKCAQNNSVDESDIGIAELINEPGSGEDYADNINDLSSGDYEILV